MAVSHLDKTAEAMKLLASYFSAECLAKFTAIRAAYMRGTLEPASVIASVELLLKDGKKKSLENARPSLLSPMLLPRHEGAHWGPSKKDSKPCTAMEAVLRTLV